MMVSKKKWLKKITQQLVGVGGRGGERNMGIEQKKWKQMHSDVNAHRQGFIRWAFW